MLTNTNKTRYSKLRKLSALPLALLALGLFSFTIRKAPAPANTANHKIIMMLDAGHGGMDAGGTNSAGVKEKDLALKLTTRLEQLAPEYDVAILQTRSNDDAPTLNQRAEASNASNADIYVSLHINKEDQAHKFSNGYMVYISEGNVHYPESKLLAAHLANSLYSIGIKPEIGNKRLHVLQANKHPAVLVECGNIDKADEMARITDPKKMDELCRTILSGVVAYANDKKH